MTGTPRPKRSRLASAPKRAVLFLSVLALVLAACDVDDDAAEPPPEPDEGQEEQPEEPEPAEDDPEEPGDAAPGELGALIQQAFLEDIGTDELHPVIVEAFERAAEPLTDEQLDLAFECWEAATCDIPDGGDVVFTFADGFGDNLWRQVSKMEAILQALTYPEVGRIVYTSAAFDVSTMQSNVRSLVAQDADVILTYNDFGPTMISEFSQAQDEGAVVASYVGPTPEAGEESIAHQVTADLCEVGREMGRSAAEVAGGDGLVAFFHGTPGNPQDAAWTECAEEVWAEEFPDVSGTGPFDTDWTPSGAFEAASALIASGEPVDAILYSYADPIPSVLDAYEQTGQAPPAILTWTMNNEMFCQWEDAQGTDSEFTLYSTNGLNWAARVSATAAMRNLEGEEVDNLIVYPMPFVEAQPGTCDRDRPADYPASALIPDSLMDRMLG